MMHDNMFNIYEQSNIHDYNDLREIHHWYSNDADVRLEELAMELIWENISSADKGYLEINII